MLLCGDTGSSIVFILFYFFSRLSVASYVVRGRCGDLGFVGGDWVIAILVFSDVW